MEHNGIYDEQKTNPSKIWEKIGNAEILLKPLENQAFLGHRNGSDFCDQKPFKNHWENKHLLVTETKPFLWPARTPKTLWKHNKNINAGKLENSDSEILLKSLEIQAFRGHRNGSDFCDQKPFKNIAKTHVSCLAQGEAGSHLRETMEN